MAEVEYMYAFFELFQERLDGHLSGDYCHIYNANEDALISQDGLMLDIVLYEYLFGETQFRLAHCVS